MAFPFSEDRAMYVRPQGGDTTLRRAAMAEQTSTTNRPPLFKVIRGATLKGSQVELLGTPDEKPVDALKPNDRVLVREFLYYRAPNSQTPLREAHIEWRNLERA